VLPLLAGCHHLPEPERLWEEAGELGYALGRRGATIKSLDLLIATYALSHGVAVLTRDRDFETMRRAGAALLLVEA
jgi:predicted nucleic acid-binding protein